MSIRKKIERYYNRQYFINSVPQFLLVFFLTPFIIGFIIYGGFPIYLFNDLITAADKDKEGIWKYVEYSTGIANLFLTVITIGLVIVTMHITKKGNQKQVFETRFFDLLKIHRENTSQVECAGHVGRKAFESIYKEIQYISDRIEKEFPKLEINKRVTVSYLAIFWGLDPSSPDLKRALFKSYPASGGLNIELITSLQNLKQDINSHDSFSPLKGKFSGMQPFLSHYFRHLFQTVKFINQQSYLTLYEKYFYVKTLRAQLSNYELSIFFFNSISYLGCKWELETKNVNDKVITKYNFIKNMPFSLALGTNVKEFYPEIKFEND